MSYGPKFSELFRRAAFYVDRISKEPNCRPSCGAASIFELVINLKTARRSASRFP